MLICVRRAGGSVRLTASTRRCIGAGAAQVARARQAPSQIREEVRDQLWDWVTKGVTTAGSVAELEEAMDGSASGNENISAAARGAEKKMMQMGYIISDADLLI